MSIAALLLVSILCLSFYTTADPDLWGHVRFGQDLWETRDLLRPDHYSYLSAGYPWTNHAWLTELLMYLAFRLGGSPGLIALKSSIALLVAGLAYAHLRRAGLLAARAGLLVALAAILLLPWLMPVRPQMFTYLCFLLLLLIIVQAEEGQGRCLWAAPPIFAFWVNLHGGFLAGVGILLLWSLARVVGLLPGWRHPRALFSRARLAAGLAVLASLAATLLNPYGLELWRFLLRTATVARPEISDWQPISVTGAFGVVYLAVLAISWLGLIYSRRPRSLAVLALFACLSIVPLVAVRHVPLFALGALILAGRHVDDALNRRPGDRSQLRSDSLPYRLWPWLAGIVSLALLVVSARWLSCITLHPSMQYPVRAVALLRQSDVSGNLAVDFDWGQYALWHLGPRIQVSLDGRRETVYSDEIYRRNLSFMFGRGEWDALLDQHETHMALVHRDRPAYNLMKLKPGWIMVYEDSSSAIFVREGWPLLPRIEAAAALEPPCDEGAACFP
jgi:hypothetical protein